MRVKGRVREREREGGGGGERERGGVRENKKLILIITGRRGTYVAT